MSLQEEIPSPSPETIKHRLLPEDSFIKQKKHQERMKEEELGNLLAAIGNHEAKALLLAAMQPGKLYTQQELHTLMVDKQGKQQVWKINSTIPFGYCKRSLHPSGLVAKEVTFLKGRKASSYHKTAYGKKIGDALAGHLLAFSEQHDGVSLIALFGSTNSPGKSTEITTSQGLVASKNRAPFTRYTIMYKLLTSQLPLRESDLARALQEDEQVLSFHLDNLSRKGLITYAAIGRAKAFSFYTLSENPPAREPTPYRRQRTRTRQVYAYLRDHPDQQIGRDAIYQSLISELMPVSQSKEKSRKALISNILAYLAKEGYAQPVKFIFGKLSEINLTDTQRTLFHDAVTLIDRLSTLDEAFLAEGRQQAAAIVADPGRFSNLLQKAKEASPQANRHKTDDMIDMLTNILARHPACTVKMVQTYLMDEYGKETDKITVGKYMKRLVGLGRITITEKRTTHYYSLPE